MKKILKITSIVILLLIIITGCKKSYKDPIIGTWYLTTNGEVNERVYYMFYEDKTGVYSIYDSEKSITYDIDAKTIKIKYDDSNETIEYEYKLEDDNLSIKDGFESYVVYKKR